MNTKQLHYYLEVLEHNSIAAAARSIDIAQPALSQHISKLEHELKTQLFYRNHKGVQLTETGAKFESHCRVILDQLERAISDIGDIESDPQGKVVIAMGQSPDNLLALPLVSEIEKQFPNIELDLRAVLSYEVVKLLKSGEADVAIAYEEGLEANNFNRELLIRENLYFVSRPTAKTTAQQHITFAEMAKHETIAMPIKDSLGHLIQHHESQTGITLRKRPPFGQLMTALRFVSEGLSNIILPSSAFYHLEEKGLLCSKKIIDPDISRNVYIATNNDRPVRNVTLKIIEQIKQCAHAAHHQNRWRGQLPEIE